MWRSTRLLTFSRDFRSAGSRPRFRPSLVGALATAGGLGCAGLAAILGVDGGSSASQRVIWRYPAAANLIAPAIDDSLAFFASMAHQVIALDRRTGSHRWASVQALSGFAPGEELLVVNDLVLFPDYDVYAFDRRTGALKWRFRDSTTTGAGYFRLSTDSTRVYAGSASGYAYAIDASTGIRRWRTRIATDTFYTKVRNPVVNAGLVVVTYGRGPGVGTGGVAALDAVTGAVRWQRELPPEGAGQPSGGMGSAVFYGSLVIASSGDGRIYGLDRATGSIVWTTPRAPWMGPIVGDIRHLVLCGDIVAASSTDQSITGLDAATGSLRWQVNPERGSILDEMTVSDSTLYVAFLTFQVASVNCRRGRVNWLTSASVDGEFWIFPAVGDSAIYVVGPSGFYALRR